MSLVETPRKLIGAASPLYWKGINPWTDARIEKLAALWKEGYSATQIILQLDHPFTRSAILGKINRLGLSGRVDVKPHAKAGNRFTNRRPDGFRRKALPRAPIVAKMPIALSPTELVAAIARSDDACSFAQLSNGMCRFPYSDPGAADFAFCGRPARGTYCTGHQQLCYRRNG